MAIAIVAGLSLALGATPSQAPEPGEPAELIVRFDSDATATERRDVRDGAGTDFAAALPVSGMQLVEVAPGQSAADAERALESSPDVIYAEPNAEVHAFVRPDDPYFPQLWAMENTGQSIRGVTGTPDADSDIADAWDAKIAVGTVVAVVDTGVDSAHPDLTPNLWRNAGESGLGRESNGLDDDLNGRVDDWRGWDFAGADNDPADENGHGTHVAGTIAADRGNGIGVSGIADGAKIMPLRVLDAAGSGKVSDVILAYAYAFKQGAKVVNLSLGSDASSRAEHDAIAAYPTMLFVAAAGNGGADGVGDDNDAATTTYPCAYLLSNVVCVAASDNRDALASFSNYGASSVDLAAPGVNIASTWPGGGYSWSSGTSMATPHVSGAAALLWAAAPDSLPPEISSALLAGTDARPAFTGRTVSGGRLNVLRSLRLVADVGVGAPAPAPHPAGGSAGSGSGSGSGSGGSGSSTSGGSVGDRVPPRLSLRSARIFRSGALVRSGLALRLRCSEACTVRVALKLNGRVLTAQKRVSLGRATTGRLVLRLTASGRRLLRQRRTSTPVLSARASDRTGNSRTITIGLRVNR
ncbi:MAG TPA: S8 family peptidase [Thermoleophilaceae bacterium]|nr:S8 family peptidase [Thermoleophilaceae bacterium]